MLLVEERDARILAVGVRVPTILGVEDWDRNGVHVVLPLGVVVEETDDEGVITVDRETDGDGEVDRLLNRVTDVVEDDVALLV